MIRKISKRRSAAGEVYSIKRSRARPSTKPIPKVNVEATKKRRARNAKRMRGVEYQTARAGAMERAGGRCEYLQLHAVSYRSGLGQYQCENSYDQQLGGVFVRCPETERLQFHEERYARGRILTKDDGKIYCYAHHRLAEKAKPHKQHRRGF